MELAAHTYALTAVRFEDGLRLLEGLGIRSVELACAGVFTDRRYGDPASLLGDRAEFARWRGALARAGISVTALSVHGEPLSPRREIAKRYSVEFRRVCRFAEKIGVRRLSLKAGLPEATPGDRAPCWIAGFPPEFCNANRDAVRRQWEERLLPFWSEHAAIAGDHGCELAFEMQAWDMVYNPRTLLELRAAVGPIVRCNFDPSHMWYQGIDPLDAIDALAGVISTVHAKDTLIDHERVRRNGLFDINPLTPAGARVWKFAVPGVGHDAAVWSCMVERLRTTGYDGEIAIEHEDPDVDPIAGIERAIRFLDPIIAAAQG
jgi:sugar phosphate isomerase/epimerase